MHYKACLAQDKAVITQSWFVYLKLSFYHKSANLSEINKVKYHIYYRY